MKRGHVKPPIVVVAFGCLVAVAGCSTEAQKEAAAKATTRLHELYNSEQFSTIYREASAAYRDQLSEPAAVAAWQRTYDSLGPAQDSRIISTTVRFETDGTYVLFSCRTAFAKGVAIERLIWALPPLRPDASIPTHARLAGAQFSLASSR